MSALHVVANEKEQLEMQLYRGGDTMYALNRFQLIEFQG
jgi:hypothetical protein